MKLDTLTVRGYKSIKALEDFKFRDLNVLIGANGAGKSNLLSLFRFSGAIAEGNLQVYVQRQGGPDVLLFGGRKRTAQIEAEFYFGENGYRITLEPTVDNRLIFQREETYFSRHYTQIKPLGKAHQEAILLKDTQPVSTYVLPALQSWRLYHFHDTSATAAVKLPHPNNDNLRLKPDAGNLAAFLAHLFKVYPNEYRRIVETIRLAAPFFGDFVIRGNYSDTKRGAYDLPVQ